MENDSNKIGISFSLERGRVLIHRSALRSIGMPSNIRFLLNTGAKKVAVQVCEAIDRDSFTVPNLEDTGSYEICSMNFINVLYRLAGWKKEKSYRIYGNVFAKNRLVEYDLSDATEITDEEFVDPELM